MVIIKKLTAKGFKSFAYKTDLIFGKGFNCVIGSNGSGKSNIVDSLCFVLGKSSAKEMRAEKSANLIYNGGKKGSPAKEAEVTIEFDNSENNFPIQTKEVAITRVVKQNGTSTYKINDEVRTRQQVLDLLNAAKIDPDGHNIILQGDIIGFMEMKPIDRRAIIEEIAGISMYEDKKQKCLNELQKVDTKLNEAEIILTEREANLRELKKERDQAIKYKELQEAVRDDKGTFLHLQIKEKEEKVSEVESKRKEAEDKIEKINKEITEIKNKIKDSKEEINNITNEVEIKGEKDQLVLRKEIEELKTIVVKANSRMEVCQNELSRIKSRKEQLNNNIKEIESKIKEIKSKKQELDQENKKHNNEERETQKKIDSFKEKHGVDTDFNKALENIDRDIDKTLELIGKSNEEKQGIIRKKDQLTFKLNALEERLNELKGATKEIEELKARKKDLKEASDKLSKAVNEDSSYALQLNKARTELTENSEELAKFRARQIGIQERTLSDLAIRKILEQKDNMKGIYGTVASLGIVDSKYSLALEIATGGRIFSIVVDNDSTAQKCIEHLKNNKLGIATFLPLNKIKSRVLEPGVKEILNQKGVHGLAVDLVKYDSKYKDVFSYVLGSTAIVDDITTARRIGVGRARMVTLEGDLMEPSGAMIGGYRSQKVGLGFKEKEVNENVEKVEEEVKKLKTLISHIESKKTSNEEIIQKLRGQKAELEAGIIRIEKSLNIEDSSSLLDDKKLLQDEIKKYDKEIINIETNVKNLNKDLDKSKENKQKIKEKLADPEIAKNLDNLEEQRLKVKEKLLEINGEIKNLDSQIEVMLLPEKDKTEKIIKQQDKEYEDFMNELNNLKEIMQNRSQELKNKEQEEKKFYSKFRDLVTKRTKLNEKVQSLETNTAREEEKLKGNEQRLNNINIDRAKAIAELEGLQKEFEPFKEAKIKRGVTLEELKIRIHNNEKALSGIGNVNLRALEVYEQIQVEYEKIVEKVSKLKSEKDDVLNMMAEVESKKKDIFMKTYNVLIKNFKEIFSQLTTKGEVHVTLENPENPFEGGVEIQVKIAGNKFLDLKSLSGGEKTLAALSFIFAIQEYSPSPFYLLDEVDAALDKRNSELLSKLVQKYAQKAQYIVISHNDNIITEAEYIYGVSMQEGITKVVSLKV